MFLAIASPKDHPQPIIQAKMAWARRAIAVDGYHGRLTVTTEG
jgi:hypothetical protein